MNKELWNAILDFQLDQIDEEYGFTIRLIKENFWTKNFADKAILEYKKFMYLAATSDRMVSPSEIIDKVWHLHLVYTKSYADFCTILGKQIQHIPSTHKKSQFQRFNLAKQRTTEIYKETFGTQPKDIWEYRDMFQSLHLTKAKYKLRSKLIVALTIALILIIPLFVILRPLIITIGNPNFLIYLFVLSGVCFLTLELFNRFQLKKMTQKFDENSFIFNLLPVEIIFSKTQNIASVVYLYVDSLFRKGLVYAKSEGVISIQKNQKEPDLTREEFAIYEVLKEQETISFDSFIKSLSTKSIFDITQNTMNALTKYIYKSQDFAKIFFINVTVLSFCIMISFIRLSLGFIREKPIAFILITTIVLCFLAYAFLYRLTHQMSKETIPTIYKDIISEQKIQNHDQWNYFLSGAFVLSAGLTTLINYKSAIKNSGSDTNSCSSCSSCSSCGGCGGCGGCGN